MFLKQKHRVALISVDGDPAAEIGQEEAGGQNVYVRQVGETLAAQGWQVDMFTRRSDPEQPMIVEHQPHCRTIRLVAGPAEFMSRDVLFDYLPEFVEQFLAFQTQEGVEYSLVHTHYWLSSWVGMRLKRQMPSLVQVHTYHSLGAVKYRTLGDLPPIGAKRLMVEKDCLETVDSVVATSPQEREHMRSLVSTQGRIDMIPCGTDISRFGQVTRAEARQQLGFAPEDKIVLYVGRFDPRKGIETLVRAVGESDLRHLPNLKLVIGGGSRPGKSDGLERDRIEGIVQALGLTAITQFPGRLGDTNLHLYYAAADVCVVPSHYEPFGLVPIEAMASHTPVVASNVGGLQYTVVPEVTGLLVPPKDAEAFARAIARILKNPAWRDKLGHAGRQRVELGFSWDSVASRLGQLYLQLIASVAAEVVPIEMEEDAQEVAA
ncbi:glycosyltransferase family 1 protein [Thermoleptolyngbya sichuanensis A183]|uniref:Glycosyltransferase family 1 protein n=1 Tax=Thermoleptolyngbya sichuanensis A183 TaxID=2737172 RepID=A0A6M8BCI7_9CYAN|nr:MULTISPECIES: glycosyltransferase family 1 protein [Thermoleptolyngbya]QKD84564.1 glycosyltransferase family 1 protein [Thermoleptolyngbya sichuanensis A183]